MKTLAKKVVSKLIKKKLSISFAESCTGGLLSSYLTAVKDSSKTFYVGLVTYSNQSKIKFLKIPKKIIRKFGAVSEKTCLSMVKNISKLSNTDISVSITGIAGPKGGTAKKPVGLVYIAIKRKNKVVVNKYLFKNMNRSKVQKAAVYKSLKLILAILK